MSYARFGPQCDWYIFWRASDAAQSEDEVLAIWRAGDREGDPEFSCRQIRDMLRRDDFSCIPGFVSTDAGFLRDVLGQFVRDVDRDYAHRAG